MATAAPIQFVAGTALKIVIIVGSNPFAHAKSISLFLVAHGCCAGFA
jgi:hypothetical protein